MFWSVIKLLRTISGALNVMGERPEDIEVALIYVPDLGGPALYHSAMDLVSHDEIFFKSEYVFDSKISKDCVEHVVSLRTSRPWY